MSAIDHQRWQKVSGHLDRMLDLPAEDRGACLAALRSDDPETAADVEALLDEHRQLSAEGFLDASAGAIPRPEPSLAGVRIGAYTLVSPIGHGGMGSVWLAARSDGRFEGHAALKLLNAALVGRAGEERFKREGTILARLTHPHIARLIDAGVTRTGQPYLVLERIEGRHIDRYCTEEGLEIEQRIRLFLDVQSAVAHAHAQLIVHRDLKPSNVLVDANGQVKLLDFGIAKLLEADELATPQTLLTGEGGQALTPKYAAPEQVTGGRITTATDVYALGVLLYELLSGHHPTGLTTATPAEFVKAVADTEPARLSIALPESADPRLRRLLRGDLETIVGKALKKNPAERYGSVAEFADDLRRFLDDKPISARPDTLGYRAAKFVRRHRRMLAAAAIVTAIVVGLVGFYTERLAAERDRARLEAEKASKISELLSGLLTGADPFRTPDGGNVPTVLNLLDLGVQKITRDLADRPELQAEMFTLIGRTYERMGMNAKALPLEEQALALSRRALGPDHVIVAQSLNNLGVLQRVLGHLDASEPLLRESLAMRRRLLGPQHPDVAITLVELARVLQDRGHMEEAEGLAREALDIRRKAFGDEHRETATSKNELALILYRRGDLAGAEPLFQQNLATTSRLLGASHASTATATNNLALVKMFGGDPVAGEALLRKALEIDRVVFGDQHPSYANTLHNLGQSLELQGRLEEAQTILEEVLRITRPRLGDQHTRVQTYAASLARVRIARGDAAATEESMRQVLVARMGLHPAGDWRIAQAQSLLGAALLAQHNYADAEPLMLAADENLKPVAGAQARERLANRARLVSLYESTGHPERAALFR